MKRIGLALLLMGCLLPAAVTAGKGEIRFVETEGEPVGNLLREEAVDVWRSTRACRYRAKSFAHPVCRTCEHFSLCHGACPLYWRERGFDELATAHAALRAEKGAPTP